MTEPRQVLHKIRQKWLLLKGLEVVPIIIGATVLTYFLFGIWTAMVICFLGVVFSYFLIKPKQYNLEKVCSHLDALFPDMEFSTSLLLESDGSLSALARIQRHKVAEQLTSTINNVKFKNYVLQSFLVGIVLIVLGFTLYSMGFLPDLSASQKESNPNEVIQFQPLDSAQSKRLVPKVVKQWVTVKPPAYSNQSPKTTTEFNLKILEGSELSWHVQFDHPVKEAKLQFGQDEYAFKKFDETYTYKIKASNANIYNLKFRDTAGNTYMSDLYSLEITIDAPPKIEIQGLPQFSSFKYDEPQILEFSTIIEDDYGIADAYIIATVSKGTGESVKFREERLGFETKVEKGGKTLELYKGLNLKSLKMEPGDELYFYVEALDYKTPKANIGRTETYFSVIKDTTTNSFGVEGTLGADLMPDYFRSQRQLIIDTEKLIADKPKLKEQEFNFTSNELGYDQKALRLKYGKFMGDESEGAFDSSSNETADAEDNDALAEYTHDHDGDNEHNLVDEGHDHDHDHDHENESIRTAESEEDPLEAYVHNHGDPEASTLFAKSLKSKLKQAMAEMWDAELYLRLYQPEKSLPYQYNALKLIQEIKNSARIYVHRIGFDPPPIKESNRLTGEIEEIQNHTKEQDLVSQEEYPLMTEAIVRLEAIIAGDIQMGAQDKILLTNAGGELAAMAIKEPGKHLETLQALKRLAQSELQRPDRSNIRKVYQGLIKALPIKKESPLQKAKYINELNQLLVKEIVRND